MQQHEVIRRPLVTEKHMHFATKNRQYAFEVQPTANKVQVRQAVEALFGVKVQAVNTSYVRGKYKRRRSGLIRTADWKKAVVTLKEGYSIDLV